MHRNLVCALELHTLGRAAAAAIASAKESASAQLMLCRVRAQVPTRCRWMEVGSNALTARVISFLQGGIAVSCGALDVIAVWMQFIGLE